MQKTCTTLLIVTLAWGVGFSVAEAATLPNQSPFVEQYLPKAPVVAAKKAAPKRKVVHLPPSASLTATARHEDQLEVEQSRPIVIAPTSAPVEVIQPADTSPKVQAATQAVSAAPLAGPTALAPPTGPATTNEASAASTVVATEAANSAVATKPTAIVEPRSLQATKQPISLVVADEYYLPLECASYEGGAELVEYQVKKGGAIEVKNVKPVTRFEVKTGDTLRTTLNRWAAPDHTVIWELPADMDFRFKAPAVFGTDRQASLQKLADALRAPLDLKVSVFNKNKVWVIRGVVPDSLCAEAASQ